VVEPAPGPSRLASRVARWLISVGLLYLVYRLVPFTGVLTALALARGWLVVLACALVLAGQMFVAWRMKLLIDPQGIQLRTAQLLEINLASSLYSLVLPWATAVNLAVRVLRLSRLQMKWTKILSALAVDRLLATASLATVGLVFWLAAEMPIGAHAPPHAAPAAIGWTMVAALAGTVFLSLVLFHPALARLWQGAVRRLPGGGIGGMIRAQSLSVAAYQNVSVSEVALVLVLAAVPHLLGIVAYVLLGESLGIAVDFTAWGWIRSAVMLATLIPVSVGGLGIRDGALLYLLAPYGVHGNKALALAFLVFGATVVFPALVGGLFEWRTLVSDRKPAETTRGPRRNADPESRSL
jgi:uncharacterized membrane protein YbhN (UPF0104 family)